MAKDLIADCINDISHCIGILTVDAGASDKTKDQRRLIELSVGKLNEARALLENSRIRIN